MGRAGALSPRQRAGTAAAGRRLGNRRRLTPTPSIDWCARPKTQRWLTAVLTVNPSGRGLLKLGYALEASNVPSDAVVGVCGAEPTLGEHAEHGVRWMVERSEVSAQESADGIFTSDD
jgi:hypothetical protein